MRIAITGGAGYVGCRLSKYLLDQGHTIDCIDWLTWGIEPILNIIDHSKFNFPSCNAQPDLAYKVNVDGTQRVINASTDKIFVYASTGSVYGEIGDICTETVEPNPISSYSVYKLQGEQMLNGTDAVILRPATAFGVSNRLRNDLLVNDFVRKACLGEDMVLFEGHFKRTFISINDLVRGFAMSLERFDDMKG